ncbi:MAG: hypothetical protein N4A54_07415 [Peptostreptococcaceae bacterium]|jgi:hypothetical protein|nr:hypothetical protein [Peptostreptococcaceae bacterium]
MNKYIKYILGIMLILFVSLSMCNIKEKYNIYKARKNIYNYFNTDTYMDIEELIYFSKKIDNKTIDESIQIAKLYSQNSNYTKSNEILMDLYNETFDVEDKYTKKNIMDIVYTLGGNYLELKDYHNANYFYDYALYLDASEYDRFSNNNYDILLENKNEMDFLKYYLKILNYIEAKIKADKYDDIKQLITNVENVVLKLEIDEKSKKEYLNMLFIKTKDSLYSAKYYKDAINYLEKYLKENKNLLQLETLVAYYIKLYESTEDVKEKNYSTSRIKEILNQEKDYFKEKEGLINKLNRTLEEKIML